MTLSRSQTALLAAEANGCDPGFIDAMAGELTGRPRTAALLADVARRYGAPRRVVERITEALDGRLIFETAPPERSTMPDNRAETILAAVKQHGTGPAAVATIRRLMPKLTEADAAALAQRMVAESAPEPAPRSAVAESQMRRAERFAESVQTARSKDIGDATLTDLENLAAASSWF